MTSALGRPVSGGVFTLRSITNQLSDELKLWDDKKIKALTTDSKEQRDQNVKLIQKLEKTITSVAEGVEKLATMPNLSGEEGKQLLDSQRILHQAVATLRKIEGKFVIIDKTSHVFWKGLKKIWASIMHSGRYVEVDRLVQTSKRSGVTQVIKDKCDRIFVDLLQLPASKLKYEPLGEVVEAKYGDETINDLGRRLLMSRGFKRPVDMYRYLNNSSMTDAEITQAKEFLSKWSKQVPYFLCERKKEGYGQWMLGYATSIGARAKGLLEYVPGVNKLPMVKNLFTKPEQQEAKATGFILHTEEGTGEIQVDERKKEFSAKIGVKTYTWNSWAKLESDQKCSFGNEALRKAQECEKKQTEAIEGFLKKTGMFFNTASEPPEGKFACVLDMIGEGQFHLSLFDKSLETKYSCEINTTDEPGKLKIKKKEGDAFIEFWPNFQEADFKKALAQSVGLQETEKDKILLSKEAVVKQAGAWGQVVDNALDENSFAKVAPVLGDDASGAYVIHTRNNKEKTFTISYYIDNEIRKIEEVKLDRDTFVCEEKKHDSLNKLLEGYMGETKPISLKELRERVVSRQSLIDEIEKHSSYHPVETALSAKAMVLLPDATAWRLSKTQSEGKSLWNLWGFTTTVAKTIQWGLRFGGSLEAKNWDYCIKQKGKGDIVLKPKFVDGKWKIVVEGDENVQYKSIDEIIKAKGLKSEECLSVLEERGKTIQQELERAAPEEDYGKGFFVPCQNDGSLQKIKESLVECAKDSEQPVGCLVFNEGNNTYSWLIKKPDEVDVSVYQITLKTSGEALFSIDGKPYKSFVEFLNQERGGGHIYSMDGRTAAVQAQKAEEEKNQKFLEEFKVLAEKFKPEGKEIEDISGLKSILNDQMKKVQKGESAYVIVTKSDNDFWVGKLSKEKVEIYKCQVVEGKLEFYELTSDKKDFEDAPLEKAPIALKQLKSGKTLKELQEREEAKPRKEETERASAVGRLPTEDQKEMNYEEYFNVLDRRSYGYKAVKVKKFFESDTISRNQKVGLLRYAIDQQKEGSNTTSEKYVLRLARAYMNVMKADDLSDIQAAVAEQISGEGLEKKVRGIFELDY